MLPQENDAQILRYIKQQSPESSIRHQNALESFVIGVQKLDGQEHLVYLTVSRIP